MHKQPVKSGDAVTFHDKIAGTTERATVLRTRNHAGAENPPVDLVTEGGREVSGVCWESHEPPHFYKRIGG